MSDAESGCVIRPFPTAIVATNSWAGRVEWPCYVLKETKKRYEVMYFRSAHTALVPKYAVRFDDDSEAKRYGYTGNEPAANSSGVTP